MRRPGTLPCPFLGGEPMPDARVSNTITGRDAFLRVLSDEGVVKMFGNPGTTELPIMHALSSAPEMGYVLALQEAIVIAMADGYARASGKLVSCNVHVAPGLGNAIGSIYTLLHVGHADDRDGWAAGAGPRPHRAAAVCAADPDRHAGGEMGDRSEPHRRPAAHPTPAPPRWRPRRRPARCSSRCPATS